MRCPASLLAMLFAGSALAHGNSIGVLSVSAQVAPSAVLRFEAKSAGFSISAADIAQGYVDIPAGELFRLSVGRFRPLVSIDSVPVDRAVRVMLRERRTPVTLNVDL